MSRITDKKVVKTSPVEVSPISTLPQSLDEGQYVPGERINAGDTEAFEFATPATSDVIGDNPDRTYLPAPRILGIKSQRIRHVDGVPVVDVVLDVEDVDGATHYQVRTALEGQAF